MTALTLAEYRAAQRRVYGRAHRLHRHLSELADVAESAGENGATLRAIAERAWAMAEWMLANRTWTAGGVR